MQRNFTVRYGGRGSGGRKSRGGEAGSPYGTETPNQKKGK
jgi:hypothetical protein